MSPAGGPRRPGACVRVLLCDDLADPPTPLEPGRLARAIRDHDEVEVGAPGRICADPAVLHRVVGSGEPLVVVCRRGHDLRRDLTARLHRAGWRFDSVDITDVAVSGDIPDQDAQDATLLAIHAAVAGVKAEPYPMASAERTIAVERRDPTRRPFATEETAVRLAMPAVDDASCRAASGCDLCVARCPAGAVTITASVARIDPTLCMSCGACVTACPPAAVRLAGFSTAQLTARLSALLRPVAPLSPPDGVIFRCMNACTPTVLGAGWSVLVVPSLHAIGVGTVLQTVVHGASSVHLAPCVDAACQAAAASVTDLATAVLAPTSHQATLTCTPAEPGRASRRELPARDVGDITLMEPAATVDAVGALAETSSLRLVHSTAPLGVVRVDTNRCTGCQACVTACPTMALATTTGGEQVLSYDARRCVGCDVCSRMCPENAISAERAIDTAALTARTVVLCRHPSRPCPTCGRPIRDAGVRRTVVARLGAASAMAQVVATTCGECGPADLGTG